MKLKNRVAAGIATMELLVAVLTIAALAVIVLAMVMKKREAGEGRGADDTRAALHLERAVAVSTGSSP